MKPVCIAFDLDNCLARFVGGKEGLFAIGTRRGIPKEIVKEVYEETNVGGGWSAKKFLNNLQKRTQREFGGEDFLQECTRWFESSFALYPDSLSTIRHWHILHIPIAIITRGDPESQRQKITMTKIPYNDLYIVPNDGLKILSLQELIHKYGKPIIFVDDKVSVLDEARAIFDKGEVITVIIRRPESSYIHKQPKYRHCEIFQLTELKQTISAFFPTTGE